jgi:vacuolar-type H+-ATPase subunit H
MAKEIASSVEALEAEAEKILEEARTTANKIVLEARAEAQRILSSPLRLDEVKTECEKIVSRARVEADEKIKDFHKQAAEISSAADKRAKEITELVVNIVTGKT